MHQSFVNLFSNFIYINITSQTGTVVHRCQQTWTLECARCCWLSADDEAAGVAGLMARSSPSSDPDIDLRLVNLGRGSSGDEPARSRAIWNKRDDSFTKLKIKLIQLNVLNLMHFYHNNWMITITDIFFVVILSNWDLWNVITISSW